MTQFGYTIFGGHADADRLAHQAAAMARATSAFLTPAGLRSGRSPSTWPGRWARPLSVAIDESNRRVGSTLACSGGHSGGRSYVGSKLGLASKRR
jgi:hypothetical protein